MMSPDYPWHNVPDYSLPFAIGFTLILSVTIILATKYKSFRPYIAILIPVGSVEIYLIYYGTAMLPWSNTDLMYSVGGQYSYGTIDYGIFAWGIGLATIIGGVTIFLLNRIAPTLSQKKTKVYLILLGYIALIIGGSSIYLHDFWLYSQFNWLIIWLVCLFTFGIYLSIIGTANYFTHKPHALL
jgi:hypothetical protein